MKKVQVLLSFYNGDKFIQDQIDSLNKQMGNFELSIMIRNDGSSSSILDKYTQTNITVKSGENLGVKGSFFQLIRQSSENMDYYCFCDQDDYWKEDKISVAIEALKNYEDVPAMYFSKATIVNNFLEKIGVDNFENGVFSFSRHFIKNNAIGCTMVFNKKLRNIIASKMDNYNNISTSFLHDHILYTICTGVGGKIIFDSTPHILYRQHDNNVVGSKRNLISKIRNNGLLNNSNERLKWAEEIYENFYDILLKDNQRFLKELINYKKSFRSQLSSLGRLKFEYKSFLEKVNIYLLLITGKF